MAARSLAAAALLVLAFAGGCAERDHTRSTGAGGSGGSGGTPHHAGDEVRITAEARSALEALSPKALPLPPADVSNRYADDPAAAAFGQLLFFDRGFSGPLLDSDNDGGVGTLGNVGESGRVACSDCHEPSAAFSDVRSARKQVSLGAAWGRRRAPSLLDVGQAKLLMWDGRRDTGYNQPIAALEAGVEMNGSRLHLAQQIYARYRDVYDAVFQDDPIEVPLDDEARFPHLEGTTTGCRELNLDQDGVATTADCHGLPGDGAEFDGLSPEDQDALTRIAVNFGKAISAYVRLLACGPSRFDEWMHGRADALSASEQRGAALFVGQRQDGTRLTGCNTCHEGPFLTDQGFHNVGMQPVGVGIAASFYDREDHGARDGLLAALADPLNVRGVYGDGDDGRLPTRVAESLNGAFRTPSLRCVAMRPTFMHNGQIATLEDVLSFFDRGGDESGFHGKSELSPLGLSEEERADLVAFLRALDGPGPPKELLSAPSP